MVVIEPQLRRLCMGQKMPGESSFQEFPGVSRLSWSSCRKMPGGSWEMVVGQVELLEVTVVVEEAERQHSNLVLLQGQLLEVAGPSKRHPWGCLRVCSHTAGGPGKVAQVLEDPG